MITPMTDSELKMVLNTAIEEILRLNSRSESLEMAIRELVSASPALSAKAQERIEALLDAYQPEAQSLWLAQVAASYKQNLEKGRP